MEGFKMNIGRKHKEIPDWIINAVEEKIMTPTKGAKLALEENNLSEHNKKYKKYLSFLKSVKKGKTR